VPDVSLQLAQQRAARLRCHPRWCEWGWQILLPPHALPLLLLLQQGSRLPLQGSEAHAWSSVYVALDDQTADGLRRLVAPTSTAAARPRSTSGGLGSMCCFRGMREGTCNAQVSSRLRTARGCGAACGCLMGLRRS
jgi:hypothetical protein